LIDDYSKLTLYIHPKGLLWIVINFLAI